MQLVLLLLLFALIYIYSWKHNELINTQKKVEKKNLYRGIFYTPT